MELILMKKIAHLVTHGVLYLSSCPRAVLQYPRAECPRYELSESIQTARAIHSFLKIPIYIKRGYLDRAVTRHSDALEDLDIGLCVVTLCSLLQTQQYKAP